MALGTGSRSPICNPILIEDYNHVQFLSPGSKQRCQWSMFKKPDRGRVQEGKFVNFQSVRDALWCILGYVLHINNTYHAHCCTFTCTCITCKSNSNKGIRLTLVQVLSDKNFKPMSPHVNCGIYQSISTYHITLPMCVKNQSVYISLQVHVCLQCFIFHCRSYFIVGL